MLNRYLPACLFLNPSNKLPELCKLLFCRGLVTFICRCKMRKDSFYLNTFCLKSPFYKLKSLFILPYTDPAHSGSHLDMNLRVLA